MAQYQVRRITKSSVNIVNSNRNGKIIAINPITVTITVGTLEFRQGNVGANLAGTFVAAGGIITSVVITNGGTNYSSINPPVIDGDAGGGADAILTPTIKNGVITAITIENGGTGYTTGSLVIVATEGVLLYEVGVSGEAHRDLNIRFNQGLYLDDNSITGDYIANVLID